MAGRLPVRRRTALVLFVCCCAAFYAASSGLLSHHLNLGVSTWHQDQPQEQQRQRPGPGSLRRARQSKSPSAFLASPPSASAAPSVDVLQEDIDLLRRQVRQVMEQNKVVLLGQYELSKEISRLAESGHGGGGGGGIATSGGSKKRRRGSKRRAAVQGGAPPPPIRLGTLVDELSSDPAGKKGSRRPSSSSARAASAAAAAAAQSKSKRSKRKRRDRRSVVAAAAAFGACPCCLPPNTTQVKRAFKSAMPGVPYRQPADYGRYSAFLNACLPLFDEVREETAWTRETAHWGTEDAAVSWCMYRTLKPRRVIEIGSGTSSLMIRDALDRNDNERREGDATAAATGGSTAAATAQARAPKSQLVCIDPSPRTDIPLDRPGLELRQVTMQELPPTFYFSLAEGDVLSLDGSHVVGPASDVKITLLEILPRLAPGVVVHIHDVTLPRRQVEIDSWDEQYLLHAFLLYNAEFRVLFPSNEMAMQIGPGCSSFYRHVTGLSTDWNRGPGSYWIERVVRPAAGNTDAKAPGTDTPLLECRGGRCKTGKGKIGGSCSGVCCPSKAAGGTLHARSAFKSSLAGVSGRDYDGFVETLERCKPYLAEWRNEVSALRVVRHHIRAQQQQQQHHHHHQNQNQNQRRELLRRDQRRGDAATRGDGRRGGPAWSGTDLALTWCFVRLYRPSRVVEIGSGGSTVVIRAALDANGLGGGSQPEEDTKDQKQPASGPPKLTAIDPSPSAALLTSAGDAAHQWVKQSLDEIPLDAFAGFIAPAASAVAAADEPLPLLLSLGRDDMLHVNGMQQGLWTPLATRTLFLEVLPRLGPGVVVHFHGVVLPRNQVPASSQQSDHGSEMPPVQDPDWIGQTYLHAFLLFNTDWEIFFPANELAQQVSKKCSDAFVESLDGRPAQDDESEDETPKEVHMEYDESSPPATVEDDGSGSADGGKSRPGSSTRKALLGLTKRRKRARSGTENAAAAPTSATTGEQKTTEPLPLSDDASSDAAASDLLLDAAAGMRNRTSASAKAKKPLRRGDLRRRQEQDRVRRRISSDGAPLGFWIRRRLPGDGDRSSGGKATGAGVGVRPLECDGAVCVRRDAGRGRSE